MKNKKKPQIPVQEPSGINIQQLTHSILKNRYWFLLAAVVGLLLALFYNAFVPLKYKLSTTLLFKADNSQATLTSVHPDIQDNKKGMTVQDQVGILTSYTINLKTLQNLKWHISWFKKGFLSNKDVYKDVPYSIEMPRNASEVKGVAIEISPVNTQQFSVKCNDEVETNGIKHKIKFEGTGFFGKPFKNQYVNFTLRKNLSKQADAGDTFLLKFNDLNQLAKAYQEDLKITTGEEGSNLITVELVSNQPARAADYLAELDKVYIKYGLEEKNRRAANTVKFINNQIAGVADSLQNTGNDFTNYRTNNSVIDINQQSSSVVNNLDRLQNDVAAAQMQVRYFTDLKRYLNDASALKSMVVPSMAGVNDASLNSLVSKLSDLYQQREILSHSAQDQSPQMVAMNEEIAFAQRSLSENVSNLLDNAIIRLESLNSQHQSVNSVKAALPKTEQNLNNIKRNLDFNNQLYTYLLQKRSEAQIALASRDPDAHILDEAGLGNATLKGFNHKTNLIIGVLSGLLFVLICLITKAFFKKKLIYVSDIQYQLQPSIVGNILFNKFDDELPVLSYPHSEITESFRSLRINISYLLQELDNKVISIHSSIAGEGKTFVSANLAAILAINNKTVLLVDADLRQPRTHLIFNNDNRAGLSTYLSGTSGFSDVVIPTKTKGLSLVTSGPKPDYPSELLGTPRLDAFITEAKKHYEYIIFNNSPLDIVKDAMMIAPFSDVNLFLLRMNKSSVHQLSYINQMLNEGVIKNVVVALNNVTADSYAISKPQDHGYYNDNRMLKLKG